MWLKNYKAKAFHALLYGNDKLRYILAFCVLVLLGLSAPRELLADTDIVKPESMMIILDYQGEGQLPNLKTRRKHRKKTSNTTKSVDGWQRNCELFGRLMEVGRGPYHYGFASSVSCVKGSASSYSVLKGDSPWALVIKEESEQLWSIKLFYRDNKEPTVDLKIDAYAKPDVLLGVGAFAKNLALYIMDRLVHPIYFSPEEVSSGKVAFKAENVNLPKPSANIKLFSLRLLKSGVYQFHLVGTGAYKEEDKRAFWVLDIGADTKNMPIWAQVEEGKCQKIDEAGNGMLEAQTELGLDGEALKNFMRRTIPGGFVGTRYGVSLIKDKELLQKMRSYSLLLEIRGGLFAGLRSYWDLIPEVKTKDQGVEESLRISRLSAGWGYDFDLPAVFDTIGFVLKVGATDVDGKVIIATDDTTFLTTPLRMKNALNLGLEVGLEKDFEDTLLRLWAASDLSGVVNISKTGQARSLRAGADLYRKVFDFSNKYSFGILAFTHFEKLSFELAKDQEVANVAAFEGISYNIVFAGLGVTMNW